MSAGIIIPHSLDEADHICYDRHRNKQCIPYKCNCFRVFLFPKPCRKSAAKDIRKHFWWLHTFWWYETWKLLFSMVFDASPLCKMLKIVLQALIFSDIRQKCRPVGRHFFNLMLASTAAGYPQRRRLPGRYPSARTGRSALCCPPAHTAHRSWSDCIS